MFPLNEAAQWKLNTLKDYNENENEHEHEHEHGHEHDNDNSSDSDNGNGNGNARTKFNVGVGAEVSTTTHYGKNNTIRIGREIWRSNSHIGIGVKRLLRGKSSDR